MSDLTVIYITANVISPYFMKNAQERLVAAAGEDTRIVSVSREPMDFGDNFNVSTPRSHINIYRQALIGAKQATTKYIAITEDDVFYSPEHFRRRPSPGKFAYNMNSWGLYTWQDFYCQKLGGRKNLNGLICERELFIEAMEERFAKYPESNADISIWAEPGKYERQLGVTVRETETFVTNPPNIVFTHEDELSFNNLGKRKRVGEIRAITIPYWGSASGILELYGTHS